MKKTKYVLTSRDIVFTDGKTQCHKIVNLPLS